MNLLRFSCEFSEYSSCPSKLGPEAHGPGPHWDLTRSIWNDVCSTARAICCDTQVTKREADSTYMAPVEQSSQLTLSLSKWGIPRTGYLAPGHVGPGLRQSPELLGRRRRRHHLETQVDVQARKLLLEVFLRFWGRGERYRRMETGVLHRISLRVSWA